MAVARMNGGKCSGSSVSRADQAISREAQRLLAEALERQGIDPVVVTDPLTRQALARLVAAGLKDPGQVDVPNPSNDQPKARVFDRTSSRG